MRVVMKWVRMWARARVGVRFWVVVRAGGGGDPVVTTHKGVRHHVLASWARQVRANRMREDEGDGESASSHRYRRD